MTLAVELPDRLEVSRVTRLLENASALSSADEVVVDASRVLFAEPYGIVLLAAAVLRREKAGLAPARYLPPKSEKAAPFLAEIGFDQLVTTHHVRSSELAIRRLSATSLDPSYMRRVATFMERAVPNTSESVAHLVETALNEMLQNVMEHAESSTDAVVLTRWYAQEENMRIAIADSGIGFVESLRRNPDNASIRDDRELLRRAVTVEGTTGRVAKRFGGLGLKRLHSVCIDRGGSVHLTSQTLDAHYSGDKNRATYSRRLSGTVIEIDFRPGPDDGSRAQSEPEDFF